MSTIKIVKENEGFLIKGRLSDYTAGASNEGIIKTNVRILPEEGVIKL